MYQSLPEAMEMLFENPLVVEPDVIPDESKIGQLTKINYNVDELGNHCPQGRVYIFCRLFFSYL